MGLGDRLARFASGAPVPVFAAVGAGVREAVQDLRLSSGLRFVETPRAASVLLVVGTIPEALAEPLVRVHDGIPHPRATVWWSMAPHEDRPEAFRQAVSVHGDVATELVQAHRELLAGVRPSEPAILPDVDPSPWRGVGPYGQGGSGMTGGTPYGRPLAQLAPDRDGLRLDQLVFSVGPFFPRFPTGLVLDLKLSGDVVQEASVLPNPYADTSFALPGHPGLEPFLRALAEPVSVAELELARARTHLRWAADALAAQGLPALGSSALRLAQRLGPGDGASVRRFAARLGWTQLFRWALGGVGRIPADHLEGLGAGPAARAAGLAEDLRVDDPVYRELGFEPMLQQRGDAAGRWWQRLEEAAQSLDLAARAGDRMLGPVSAIESPRGRLEPGSAPTDRILPLLPAFVEGLEWGDAIATIVSLDLDLEEAAVAVRLATGAARS